jgi:hypothetical protein
MQPWSITSLWQARILAPQSTRDMLDCASAASQDSASARYWAVLNSWDERYFFDAPNERRKYTKGDAMTDRKIFGLVTRLVGGYVVLYGMHQAWSGIALLIHLYPSTNAEGYTPSAYLSSALVRFVLGLLLLKGEWLVKFAYGQQS